MDGVHQIVYLYQNDHVNLIHLMDYLFKGLTCTISVLFVYPPSPGGMAEHQPNLTYLAIPLLAMVAD